jgi:hypothetical protein
VLDSEQRRRASLVNRLAACPPGLHMPSERPVRPVALTAALARARRFSSAGLEATRALRSALAIIHRLRIVGSQLELGHTRSFSRRERFEVSLHSGIHDRTRMLIKGLL